LQGYGPRRKPAITQHTFGSVRRCEGMNPHTPKEFHFGSWSLDEILEGDCRVKIQWLEKFFISLKSSWNVDI